MKKITDAALADLGLDVTWVRERQRIAEETEVRIRAAHQLPLEERRDAIAAIHLDHKAQLAALNP